MRERETIAGVRCVTCAVHGARKMVRADAKVWSQTLSWRIRMQQSQTLAKIAGALVKVQSAIKKAPRSTDNEYFKTKYADLEAVWDACREALTENKIAVVQTTRPPDQTGNVSYLDRMPYRSDKNLDEPDSEVSETSHYDASVVVVCTMLLHESGEYIAGELALRPKKSDPQGIGSAITYARRYHLAMMVGVATADDDGNIASGREGKPQSERPQNPAATKAKESASRSRRATPPKNDPADELVKNSAKKGFDSDMPTDTDRAQDQYSLAANKIAVITSTETLKVFYDNLPPWLQKETRELVKAQKTKLSVLADDRKGGAK